MTLKTFHHKMSLQAFALTQKCQCWTWKANDFTRNKSPWINLPNFYKFSQLQNYRAGNFSGTQGKHCNSLSEIQSRRQNKSAKYVLFVQLNPWNGNLTQVGSRSFLGSWELLGIFKSLFVFTLENQALASAPLNPPLRTQRQSRGMLNVNGQTAAAPSENERRRYEAWPPCARWCCYEGPEVKLYSHC